jgi:transposase InsO family protein
VAAWPNGPLPKHWISFYDPPNTTVVRRPIELGQYASRVYRAVLAAHGVVQSMSKRGDCHGNAVAESFFATLEHGLLTDADFASREAARRATVEFIAVWYNGERRHSSIGYLSPVQYEQRLWQAARQVRAA